MSHLTSLLSAALVLLAACASQDGDPRPPRGPRVLVVMQAAPGGPGAVNGPEAHAVATVEVVATPAARERGLMYRDRLAVDSGMLFVYPDEARRHFWMMNTRIPLSIAYADARGRIVSIRDMEAGFGKRASDLPQYDSGRPAKYALEMTMGWFRDKGFAAGDVLRFDPAILAVRSR